MPFADVDAFLKLGGPGLVIAHRGFSGIALENALAAFRRAIEFGADTIELDALPIRDGKTVVLHDDPSTGPRTAPAASPSATSPS